MAKFHRVSGIIDLTLDDIAALGAYKEMICSSGPLDEAVLIRLVQPDMPSKAEVLDALGLRPTSVSAGTAGGGKSTLTRLSDGKPIGSPPEPTTVEKGGTPH